MGVAKKVAIIENLSFARSSSHFSICLTPCSMNLAAFLCQAKTLGKSACLPLGKFFFHFIALKRKRSIRNVISPLDSISIFKITPRELIESDRNFSLGTDFG